MKVKLVLLILFLSVALGIGYMLMKPPRKSLPAVVDDALEELEHKGLLDKVAGLVYDDQKIQLSFYGKADPQVVEIVKAVIDREAPLGTPLEIVENVTVLQQVVDDACKELDRRGLLDKVAILAYNDVTIELGFYGKADPEVVEIVKAVIDREAPLGTPLEIVENVTVLQQVVDDACKELDRRGLLDKVAILAYNDVTIELGFYGKADPEVVEIVKAVIERRAPGTPLGVVENVTVETQIDRFMVERTNTKRVR